MAYLGEPSEKAIRARPLLGQGLSTEMKVECSSKMRNRYPIGTKIVIQCKVTDRKGGLPFLYSHYNSPYRVVTGAEAADFVRSRYGKRL